MAEELDDGEFWLPSQFLTDDDILNDFALSDGFGSGSSSIETESSDDDDQLLLSHLPRQLSQSSLNCPVHSKGCMLSSSPQSTLFGCGCKGSGSSLGSPNGPVSPPKEEAKGVENDVMKKDKVTLDLLNKAAGEVAKMKIRNESGRSTVGTGFFDCSNSVKGLLCPPQPQSQPPTIPTHYPPFYSRPHFNPFAHMMWGPVHYPQPQQQQQPNKATTNKNSNTTNNGRPLGLPQSAWPPLPGQPQAQTQPNSLPPPSQPQSQPITGMYMGQPGQKGTGVFLPRRVTPTTETKKKSDGNATKTKNKGSQRRSSRAPIDDDLHLPPEWVY